MKLASLKEGGRDGTLIVVDRALARAVRAGSLAPTLQRALDDWAIVEPKLGALAQALEADEAPGAFALDTKALAAPLPRAVQWADGSAYVVHVELVRKARGVEMPPSFWTDPLMYQGGSDSLIGPNDDIAATDEAWGIDFEGEIGVIVDDVPMGISPQAARRHIKLVTILNDVSLRNLIVTELAKGFCFFHGKPATAFAPVAVTPDELGDAWDGAKLDLSLISTLNGREFGHPNAATDLTFDFGQLIAHAARTRHLAAGTIVNATPSAASELIYYDLDTCGGHSGSPVWVRAGETRNLVAIHTGRPSWCV